MLYSFQSALPRLPVPAVEDTMTRVRGTQLALSRSLSLSLSLSPQSFKQCSGSHGAYNEHSVGGREGEADGHKHLFCF